MASAASVEFAQSAPTAGAALQSPPVAHPPPLPSAPKLSCGSAHSSSSCSVETRAAPSLSTRSIVPHDPPAGPSRVRALPAASGVAPRFSRLSRSFLLLSVSGWKCVIRRRADVAPPPPRSCRPPGLCEARPQRAGQAAPASAGRAPASLFRAVSRAAVPARRRYGALGVGGSEEERGARGAERSRGVKSRRPLRRGAPHRQPPCGHGAKQTKRSSTRNNNNTTTQPTPSCHASS